MLTGHIAGLPIEEMAGQWAGPVGLPVLALAGAWVRGRFSRRTRTGQVGVAQVRPPRLPRNC